jgi:hypothetical protein
MLSFKTPASAPRYTSVTAEKAEGATYTPSTLAHFVATQMLQAASIPSQGKIRLLDPAVGNGILLEAMLDTLPETTRQRVEVFAFDTHQPALHQTRQRLEHKYPDIKLNLEKRDFLALVADWGRQQDLFSTKMPLQPFDLIIANPPYVRTQIIGADQAQLFAKQFGLTGRVDLYYPFLLGISRVLAPQGTAGIITSNRFMTTKSGQSVRQALLSCFDIAHVWDLGDTKLFDAAVLPAVLVVNTMQQSASNNKSIPFSSIYATTEPASTHAKDALSALANPNNSIVSLPDGGCFHIKHGTLDNGDSPEGVWRVASQSTDAWLDTVTSHTWGTFGDIGKIRVGVKTTADKVFIRHDWAQLPNGVPELVRPLITRHWAQPFKSIKPVKANHIKQILYPHEIRQGKRQAVDIKKYPKTQRYLETNKAVLSARTYVIEAGRQWYEIWVPQDPAAWSAPKLVFPDIAERPTFWLDTDGGIVSGECYWLQCKNPADADLLWLALAVANSTFIESFYDHRFNNKLYAGRRRFITQYVEKFPLPNPDKAESKMLIQLAKDIYATLPSAKAEKLIVELDAKVWEVFGLTPEKITR